MSWLLCVIVGPYLPACWLALLVTVVLCLQCLLLLFNSIREGYKPSLVLVFVVLFRCLV